jgi:cobalt-zinc-cadmium efflux system outer membrane protein
MYYGKLRALLAENERAVYRLVATSVFFASLLVAVLSQQAVAATQLPQTTPAQTQSSPPPAAQGVQQHQHPAGQAPRDEHAPPQTPSNESLQTVAAGPLLRLADLERMAFEGNPTMAQAEAAIRAAEGRRVQAGLWPNPIIGYVGSELAPRAFNERSEHGVFVEQNILLGGKLRKSRNIFANEKVQAEVDAVAQRQRILNAVRMLYYEALGAQQLVEVREQLAKLAREAVGITNELLNVGQADRPDKFQIVIEAQRAQLDLVIARNEQRQVWQQLGAVVGNPFLKPTPLDGSLEKGLPALDHEVMLATLLRDSPEMKRAQAGIERARATIARAKAEPVPDLFVRGSFGYSTELIESRNPRLAGRKAGPVGELEIGLRIPLFNRNQGNIAAAGSELDIAEREARRVELTLRARMASVFNTYRSALDVATQYQAQIIPNAQQAYDMYFTNFRQMAAAYPQALIAQRTLFQVRADYVRALVDVWEGAVQIQGFLLTGGLDAPISARVEGAAEAGQGSGSSIERHGGVNPPDGRNER